MDVSFSLKRTGLAPLNIKGKKEEDVFFTDCTVTGAKYDGVYGRGGAAMHLKNVCVEKCGRMGVFVQGKRNTRNTTKCFFEGVGKLLLSCGRGN